MKSRKMALAERLISALAGKLNRAEKPPWKTPAQKTPFAYEQGENLIGIVENNTHTHTRTYERPKVEVIIIMSEVPSCRP